MELRYIRISSPEELAQGTFLAILNCNSTPPHLGMVSEARYHSLTIKGYRTKTVRQLLTQLNNSGIPAVFVEVISDEGGRPDFPSWRLDGSVSCLVPIAEHYGLAGKNNTVHNLLEYFRQEQMLGKVLALSDVSEDGSYKLPEYTFADVNSHIQNLLHK